ncbi:hypothetical protein ACHHYP_12739 [Achlya hypogyna]|uniref:PH domain-containing protein n=1 Tax=Achlya hypogyna TaxID=1202772 RepID=A0A1V9ZGZ2_ACHHY|nr:hypothetical protein ACHHYP_12739 [Achlya hypogyna]
MASIGDVVVGFRKGATGQLHMGLELRRDDDSRELISKEVLDSLYQRHRDLQPRVDRLFSALMAMNQAFAAHGYDGWRIESSGQVVSDVAADADAVAAFNAKLADLNGFITHHKQRGRSNTSAPREHRGWVCKQGSFVKNWKRRFMVLQNGHLHYFDTDQLSPSLKPKGSFAVSAVERAADTKYGLLAIGPNSRTLKFYMDDAAACDAWMEALLSHLRVRPGALAHAASSPAVAARSPASQRAASFSTTQPPATTTVRRASTTDVPPPTPVAGPPRMPAPPADMARPQTPAPSTTPTSKPVQGPPPPRSAPTPAPVSRPTQPPAPVTSRAVQPPTPTPPRPLAHAPSAPALVAKRVELGSVLVALSKASTGALAMSLKTLDGAAYRVVVAAELNALYAAHPRFKPLVDGLFTAMTRLNARLALRQFSGWSLSAAGQVDCAYCQAEAAAFNTALAAVNRFIVSQKHGVLAKAPSESDVDLGQVARSVAANVPVGLTASVVGLFSPELGNALRAAAPVLEAGQAALREQENAKAKPPPRAVPPVSASPLFPTPVPEVHDGIQCDSCKLMPIVGPRFQATRFPTIDVCGACVRSPQCQAAWGPFQQRAKVAVQALAVHTAVQCDGCGTTPIVGPRFSSKAVANFDVCARCVARFRPTHGPFNVFRKPRELKTHHGVRCDGCAMHPLRGKRFASARVANFDLCAGCVASGRFDGHFGPFKQVDVAKVQRRVGVQQRNDVPPPDHPTTTPAGDGNEREHDQASADAGMYESDEDTFAGDDGSYDGDTVFGGGDDYGTSGDAGGYGGDFGGDLGGYGGDIGSYGGDMGGNTDVGASYGGDFGMSSVADTGDLSSLLGQMGLGDNGFNFDSSSIDVGGGGFDFSQSYY